MGRGIAVRRIHDMADWFNASFRSIQMYWMVSRCSIPDMRRLLPNRYESWSENDAPELNRQDPVS